MIPISLRLYSSIFFSLFLRLDTCYWSMFKCNDSSVLSSLFLSAYSIFFPLELIFIWFIFIASVSHLCFTSGHSLCIYVFQSFEHIYSIYFKVLIYKMYCLSIWRGHFWLLFFSWLWVKFYFFFACLVTFNWVTDNTNDCCRNSRFFCVSLKIIFFFSSQLTWLDSNSISAFPVLSKN